jgi:hypothetical protein
VTPHGTSQLVLWLTMVELAYARPRPETDELADEAHEDPERESPPPRHQVPQNGSRYWQSGGQSESQGVTLGPLSDADDLSARPHFNHAWEIDDNVARQASAGPYV